MTWQTRLNGYLAGGSTVVQAFDGLSDDLDTMRDVALADDPCPEEVSFIADMYAEDKVKLAALRKAHVDTVKA